MYSIMVRDNEDLILGVEYTSNARPIFVEAFGTRGILGLSGCKLIDIKSKLEKAIDDITVNEVKYKVAIRNANHVSLLEVKFILISILNLCEAHPNAKFAVQ